MSAQVTKSQKFQAKNFYFLFKIIFKIVMNRLLQKSSSFAGYGNVGVSRLNGQLAERRNYVLSIESQRFIF